MVSKTIAIVLFCVQFSHALQQNKCIPRSYGLNSIVCVCNATYCDTIPHPDNPSDNEYLSCTSTASGLRFKFKTKEFKPTQSQTNYTVITVDSEERYQAIIGWGGAFTDSTGITIRTLSTEAADSLMRSYFSEDGLGYNLCRVPMGGTDFSTHAYSYDDGESDPELFNFKLASEDYQYKIPLIKQAQNLSNGQLELFADVWTAPKWMKTNEEYGGPGSLKNSMYQPWANYFLKCLQAYETEGVSFWGLATGNEPSFGFIPTEFNSVGWLPSQMRKWIGENLGPTIRQSEFSSIKLMTVDDQVLLYPWFIDLIFENEKVKEYVDGFGLHWYSNSYSPREALTKTHAKYPDKFILATEACAGNGKNSDHVRLGDWNRAENYAQDIINDLNNWVAGWLDWNMALNEMGGPNYIKNYVDSSIIVNATADEFYKQPMYYALGHFVKFLPRGSERVSVTQSDKLVEVVAFQTPNNSTVIIILNKNDFKVPVHLRDASTKEIRKVLPRKSITTFLY